MNFSFSKLLFLMTGLTTLASASTMTGTVTGTCGFFQGTPSNVVYSQSFSGSGTFCNTFVTGGSFTITSAIAVGDISASTSHLLEGFAPTGYGEFVTINTTYQVTQDYLFTPTVQPTTPTGVIQLTTGIGGGPDDGTATSGACQEGVSLNSVSNSNYHGQSVTLPITFGQPVAITETASLTCNLSFTRTAQQLGFSDDGLVSLQGAIPLVYDATGKYVGMATYKSVNATPEPATAWLVGTLGVPLLLRRRLSGKRAPSEEEHFGR